MDDEIESVFNDDNRNPKNNNSKDRYTQRLNYNLTESLSESLQEKNYVLKKYTLFPDLIEKWQNKDI